VIDLNELREEKDVWEEGGEVGRGRGSRVVKQNC